MCMCVYVCVCVRVRVCVCAHCIYNYVPGSHCLTISLQLSCLWSVSIRVGLVVSGIAQPYQVRGFVRIYHSDLTTDYANQLTIRIVSGQVNTG